MARPLYKRNNASLCTKAILKPSQLCNEVKLANNQIAVNANNIKIVKGTVRIPYSSIVEGQRLLSMANLGDLVLTATLPFVETKSESVNNVFRTFKYVISGLPIDVSNDEMGARKYTHTESNNWENRIYHLNSRDGSQAGVSLHIDQIGQHHLMRTRNRNEGSKTTT